MKNRTQQRFDRSIREAVAATHAAQAARPRRPVRPWVEPPPPPHARMVLLLDPETGGTVLVPWAHPLAVATRSARQSKKRAK